MCIEVSFSLFWGYFGSVGTVEPPPQQEPCVNHAYAFDSYLCDTSSPCCTVSRAKERLAYHMVPSQGNDPVGPFPERRNALLFGFGGPITSQYDVQAGVGVNITLPEHPLYNGSVTRSIFQSGSQVRVKTVGAGCNYGWGAMSSVDMMALNTVAGYFAFTVEDNQLRGEMQDCLGPAEPDPFWFF